MANPAKLTLQIAGEISASFRKSIKDAQKQVSTFSQNVRRGLNDAAAGASKGFKNVVRSDAFQTAAVAATGLGVAMKGAVQTAMEFESGMLKVKAISGATDEQFKALTNQAKELGRTTQFSASQAADAMGFLSMAGYDTEQILASTGHMMNLAAAGEMELGQAADIASNILGGMNLKVSETNRVIDVLAKTASSGNTNLSMLGESFKPIASIAPQAGVSMEQAGAAFAVLGNSGIQASEAGTALRNILLRMSAPPSEAAKAFDKLGVSTKDSAGNMRPYADVLRDVSKRMTALNLGTAEQTEIQAAIFGTRAAASGATLMQAAANGELAKMVQKVTDSQGAAAEMAGTMQSGLGGAMKRLQSAAEGLAIAFGGPLLGPIATVAEGIAAVLSPIGGLLEASPVLAVALGAVSAAFVGFVAVLPILAAIKGAVVALGITAAGVGAVIFSPVTLAIAAVVGLIAIFQIAYNKVGWFKAGVDAALGFIGQGFQLLGRAIKVVWDGVFGYVSNVFTNLWTMIQGIVNTIAGVFKVIGGIFMGDAEMASAGVQQIFSGLGQWFSGWVGTLGAVFGPVIETVGGAFQALPGIVIGIFQGIVDFIRNIPSMIADIGATIVNTIIEGIKSRIQALLSTVTGVFDKVRDLLPFSDAKRGPFKDLTDSGRAIMRTVSAGVGDREDVLKQAMTGAADKANRAFGERVELMGDKKIDAPSSLAMSSSSVPIIAAPKVEMPVPAAAVKQQNDSPLRTILPLIGSIIPQARPFTSAASGLLDQMPAPAAAAAAPGGGNTATMAPVININVAGTNASADEIAAAVSSGIEEALLEAEAGYRALLND